MADKNIELKLRDIRLSFAHLFDVQEDTNDDGSPSYSYNMVALVPKKLADGKPNPQIKIIQDAMKQAILNEWGAEKPPQIPPERRCLRDGEPKDPDTVDPDVPGSGTRIPLYEGYEGMCALSAKKKVASKDAPNPVALLDSRKGPDGKFPRLRAADGKLYSGCYADIVVRIYAYNGTKKNHPHRVNCSLEAVKFVRHGDAFGAKPIDADAAFDEEPAEDGFDEPTTTTTAGRRAPAPDDDDMLG